MRMNGEPVPGSFVEIQNITNKDGTELAPDNWRHKNIGMITLLHLAGGIRRLTPFFEIKIRMEEGKVVELDLDWEGLGSSTLKPTPRSTVSGCCRRKNQKPCVPLSRKPSKRGMQNGLLCCSR